MKIESAADLGAAIRKRREACGLTQTQFAELLGATQQRVSMWETGVHPPPFERLCEVLAALSLTMRVQ